MTLTTERISAFSTPKITAPQAEVSFGQSGPARNPNKKIGVRGKGNVLSVFPPEAQLAMRLDKNFSVGVDPNSGTHYLVIDSEIARGSKLNIYI